MPRVYPPQGATYATHIPTGLVVWVERFNSVTARATVRHVEGTGPATSPFTGRVRIIPLSELSFRPLRRIITFVYADVEGR